MAELTREEVDKMQGPVLLEFGAGWCPICQAFQPEITQLMKKFPQVKHFKIEDGKGKPLGRSFKVKLWPNLVFMKDGQQLDQLARPHIDEVEEKLERLLE